jgi:glutaredoxin
VRNLIKFVTTLGSFGLLCYTTGVDTFRSRRYDAKEKVQLKVRIYTKPGCPYCAKARESYTAQGIAFEELNAQDNLKFREEMLSITDGDPTVPVIVEDGRLKQIGWEGRG